MESWSSNSYNCWSFNEFWNYANLQTSMSIHIVTSTLTATGFMFRPIWNDKPSDTTVWHQCQSCPTLPYLSRLVCPSVRLVSRLLRKSFPKWRVFLLQLPSGKLTAILSEPFHSSDLLYVPVAAMSISFNLSSCDQHHIYQYVSARSTNPITARTIMGQDRP